jgi:predicted pyridoxine 5'-phosphate oxidase superfamily flavin-nucleotide-binding protein
MAMPVRSWRKQASTRPKSARFDIAESSTRQAREGSQRRIGPSDPASLEGGLLMEQPLYHEGSRTLQDRFDSRRIADRLEQVTLRHSISEGDRVFIERCGMFFLATADPQGQPDCSYKGGMPGFVQVVDAQTLAFPDYDGNGMFRSMGNILVHAQAALLFIDFEHPNRLRVHGRATVHDDDPLLAQYPGAQLIVRVAVERIFPNCPRYIHTMQLVAHSVYAPRLGHEPPEPEWKQMDEFRDALPRRGAIDESPTE